MNLRLTIVSQAEYFGKLLSSRKDKKFNFYVKKVLNHPPHSYLDQEYRNLNRDSKPRYI